MTRPNTSAKQLVIYQAKSGAIELQGDFAKETIWATQAQIASAFEVDVRTVNEHITNIYKSNELELKPTIRKFRIVQKEGKREVEREVQHYNLDLILSVGYRVNSVNATKFRQWATQTLHSHIVEGYTINRKRVTQNYDSFMRAVENVRAMLPAGSRVDTASVLELIKLFAGTWFSLHAYDTGRLAASKQTKKKVTITARELGGAIAELKAVLQKKGEASTLFAAERSSGALEGIIGNVLQSFGGREVYPSVQAKASHLLYFMVKNHPFTDGNKRSGAFAFVWFLRRAGALSARLTPEALTALTLLIAESNPKDKDKMTGLVAMLLGQ